MNMNIGIHKADYTVLQYGAGEDDNNDSDDEGTGSAPSVYKRSTFFRQTRSRGKFFKTVMERYVRDNLGLLA